jgi:hypothetical protein
MLSLTAMDVESLFTNIPQEPLLRIIQEYITELFHKEDEQKIYMDILRNLINFNTFQADNKFFLQKIGLPMGHPLSGTLANIYLGYMEKNVILKPEILCFMRYMDDAFLVTNFQEQNLLEFINELSNQYQLKVTAFHSDMKIDFLDMSIHYSSQRKFTLSPFSKNSFMLPIPSYIVKRNHIVESRIINSQILRMWRLSTNDILFSKCIINHMQYIRNDTLRKKIYKYLSPVKLSTNKWTTNIILCDICQSICADKEISMSKFFTFQGCLITTNSPVNCLSNNVYILSFLDVHPVFLLENNTIHYFLSSTDMSNTSITPLQFPHDSKFNQFLLKYPSIVSNSTIPIQVEKQACCIHPIYRNSRKVYGMSVNYKKRNKIGTFFNSYKKLFIKR